VAVAAWFGLRNPAPPSDALAAARGSAEPPTAASSGAARLSAASASPPRATHRRRGQLRSPSASDASRPQRSAPPKTVPLPSASASAASDVAAWAQLRLTADPQATVTVVGAHVAQTHDTPVRGLKLCQALFGDVPFAHVRRAGGRAGRAYAGASRSVSRRFSRGIPERRCPLAGERSRAQHTRLAQALRTARSRPS
jgi:hypothetical protein